MAEETRVAASIFTSDSRDVSVSQAAGNVNKWPYIIHFGENLVFLTPDAFGQLYEQVSALALARVAES